jgi:flagellar hook protein FlgE
MSFQQALSGLNGAAKNLEVIGNNVSNSQTVGFKQSRTEFADVYAASLNGAGGAAKGIGVNVAAVTQQFTQGNITATDNPMDLAINGDGFFQVGDGISPPSFTRNGEFKVVQGRGNDSDKRFIADNNGMYLLGIPAGQTTPGRLFLPTGRIPAQPTTEITLELNLQSDVRALSNDTAPIAAVADLNKAGIDRTIDYTTSQNLFDGKGQKVAITYFFRKLEADPNVGPSGERDSWAVFVTANGALVPVQPPPGPGEQLQPAFIARFDRQDGRSPDFLNPANIGAGPTSQPPLLSVPSTTDPLTGAVVEPINDILLNMAGFTQFSSPFGVTKVTQDGFPSGELQDFQIEPGGTITARYSNGQSAPAGQVQLVRFLNPQGLQPTGGNLWASTVASGAPTANNPGQGGTGDLLQGSLEESNVDLTAELVNMITAQRAYQANAQTIKTMDQVLQTVVNLR